MFCEKCGVKQPDNAKFCSNCGNNVGEKTSTDTQSKPIQSPTPPPQARAVAPQPVYQQQVYQQPVYQQTSVNNPLNAPLSVGSYIGMFFLMSIPLVNFIFMLIWLFGSNTNKNKKNFAIAVVVFTIIMIVISIVFSGVIGAILYPLLSDIQYNTY